MGNTPSRSSGSSPQSPASGAVHFGSANMHGVREPRRRESIATLVQQPPKASAAPPSAVLESTTAHAFARAARPPSRRRSHTTALVSSASTTTASSASSHARLASTSAVAAASSSSATTAPPPLFASPFASSSNSAAAAAAAAAAAGYGVLSAPPPPAGAPPTAAAAPAPAAPSAAFTSAFTSAFTTTANANASFSNPIAVVPAHAVPAACLLPAAHLPDSTTMGSDQSKPNKHDKALRDGTPPNRPSPFTKPVDVPAPAVDHPKLDYSSAAPPSQSGTSTGLPPGTPIIPETYSLANSTAFTRPPRLPLPIEEEIHTPGSPIISPADLGVPLDPIDGDGTLPRRASVLSSTTMDEDEEGVDDFNLGDGEIRPTVPTLIEWRGDGERIYVTGTFAGWDRKFRLHRDGPSRHKGALSAIIPLIPGTHHLKFIVDGDMRLSDDLPTAVDFTNILVNYIEVSPDQLHPPSTEDAADANVALQPPTDDAAAQTGPPTIIVPPGLHPPQVLPPTPEIRPVSAPSTAPSAIPDAPADSSKPTPVVPGAPKKYHNTIPKFLADLDAAEESSAFGRANAAVSNLPAPPTLPMFLSRSILNGATPMKDDASVLNMPNHTVLNHLATSSIRNNVLATSSTTRYKRKFLTTIMYKPTNEIGD